MVNSLVNPVLGAGFDREDLQCLLLPQSVANSLDTIKKVMISRFAQLAAAGSPAAATALPAITVGDAAAAPNAMEALGLVNSTVVAGAVEQGKQGLPAQVQEQLMRLISALLKPVVTGWYSVRTARSAMGWIERFCGGNFNWHSCASGPFCAAQRYEGNIALPYF